jgi:hypothetical protein
VTAPIAAAAALGAAKSPTSANQSNQRQKILFFLVKILHEPPRQGRFVFEGTQSLYIRGS